MGAAACGGRGFKGRAAVIGERQIGAGGCRQQHNPVSCQPPLPFVRFARIRLIAASFLQTFKTSTAWQWC